MITLTQLGVAALLGLIAYGLHYGAKKTPTDDKTFGTFGLGFSLVLSALVVFTCFSIRPLRDGISTWIDQQLGGIAAPDGAGKKDPPLTLGSPADYVTWDGDTLRRNGKELPKGWRVAYTLDQKTAGDVIANDFPRKVDAGVWKVWIYLDPDTKILPDQRTTAPAEFPRPVAKK